MKQFAEQETALHKKQTFETEHSWKFKNLSVIR